MSPVYDLLRGDRTTHPYIIYRSGNEGNRHQKLEVIIDTILMQEIRGIQTWKTPVCKEIGIGRRVLSLPAGDAEYGRSPDEVAF